MSRLPRLALWRGQGATPRLKRRAPTEQGGPRRIFADAFWRPGALSAFVNPLGRRRSDTSLSIALPLHLNDLRRPLQKWPAQIIEVHCAMLSDVSHT